MSLKMPFALPANFPIVGLGLSSYLALNMLRVSSARKQAGVLYPNMYASEAEAAADPKKMKFNCAQRAHQNTLEVAPATMAAMLYMGLFYPVFSTGAFTAFVVGRVFYTLVQGRLPRPDPAMGVSLLKAYELFF